MIENKEIIIGTIKDNAYKGELPNGQPIYELGEKDLERVEQQLVKNLAISNVSKRSFFFDYIGKVTTNEEGIRLGESLTARIFAYDKEHAIALFKDKYPNEPFDEPYS